MSNEKLPEIYSFPCVMSGLSKQPDNSVKFTFQTQETEGVKVGALYDMSKKPVFLFISDAIMTAEGVLENMPEPIKPKETKKSQSAKLRTTLFKLYKANDANAAPEEFEKYYEDMMTKIINHYNNLADEKSH